MKFSILVPVYNVEQYLEQCVESLLNQTYTGDYEIILVDDGSTDSSGAICDRYAKNYPGRVKVVHKENGGHTSARLAAINNASGEYCLFSDSDDFVEPVLLETVTSVLDKNPGTDMVMYSFSYYEDGIKTPGKLSVFENGEVFEGDKKKKLYELLITTPYINSLWTKAVRTDIIKKSNINYDVLKDKDIAEDAYIVSHLVTDCKKIVYTDNPLYNYRTNRKSISRSYNPKKIERKNSLFLYRNFIDLLPKWEMNNEETINKIYSACFNYTVYLFRKYYEYAGSFKNRKAVLEYNWDSMLFDEVAANPYKYGSEIHNHIYKMILSKQYFRLNIWFLRNKIYQRMKKIKKKIRGV